MKVELRKFAWYSRLSEETNAFNSDIYIDGVRSISASNEGHGGGNELHDIVKGACDRLQKYARSLPPVPCDFGDGEPLKMDLDLFVGQLVEAKINEQLDKKELTKLKKSLTKEVMFTYKDKTGVYSLKLKKGHVVTPEIITKFRSSRSNLEAVLNELPAEQVLAMLKAAPETVGGSALKLAAAA